MVGIIPYQPSATRVLILAQVMKAAKKTAKPLPTPFSPTGLHRSPGFFVALGLGEEETGANSLWAVGHQRELPAAHEVHVKNLNVSSENDWSIVHILSYVYALYTYICMYILNICIR